MSIALAGDGQTLAVGAAQEAGGVPGVNADQTNNSNAGYLLGGRALQPTFSFGIGMIRIQVTGMIGDKNAVMMSLGGMRVPWSD